MHSATFSTKVFIPFNAPSTRISCGSRKSWTFPRLIRYKWRFLPLPAGAEICHKLPFLAGRKIFKNSEKFRAFTSKDLRNGYKWPEMARRAEMISFGLSLEDRLTRGFTFIYFSRKHRHWWNPYHWPFYYSFPFWNPES